ncbi:response regulator [Rhodoferax sp. GW822-FHT02A01]|uniref:response regulator n=1 Tax=Rhodoferax sp. GW822-FHT02A01 TaxID=3141537 RepID=UPI00315C56C6
MLVEEVVEASSEKSTLLRSTNGRSSLRQLAGMRILVVEDNLINQQVADELLTAEGAIVSLAANGQLAVEAVASAAPQFDAILMDIQMPVLDGYSATKIIREELELKELPIIAMSANVMASDREACLAAGMNDHVGKPFDISNLVSILIRNDKHRSAENEWIDPRPTADQRLVLEDIPGLDMRLALGRMSGNRALYTRTAQDFIRILDSLIPELKQKHSSGDSQQVIMRLHTLKGNAGTLGASQLAAQAAELEIQYKSNNWIPDFGGRMDELAPVIKTTKAKLLDAIHSLLSPNAP